MNNGIRIAAAMAVLSGVAHAQSQVTLYGIVDNGLTYVSNSGGSRLVGMASGGMQAARWGMRGVEDLGGGLKATFRLENGYDLNTGKFGQGGLEFGRQANVGLSGRYGAVLLGRQYDSVIDYVGRFAFSNTFGASINAHPGDIDNFNSSNRINNAVKFQSADYAGFSMGGLYSLGGIAGNSGRNQIYSVGAAYARGPLNVGVGYLNVRNPNVSFFGNSTTGTVSSTTSNIASPVYAGFGSANTYQVVAAGASYEVGDATLGATYSNIRFINLGAAYASPFAGQSQTFNNGEVSLIYRLNPALLLGASYNYTRGTSVNGKPAAQYHQGAMGIDYFLSKRTDLYLVGVYQHASGVTLSSSGTGVVAAVASIGGLTASSNQNQVALRAGIRTKF
ncbi:porin [Pandoraea sp. ISTKB]|uniref:porin n=1 Tax=Pandoraea sp. ISTKB TaxID=1586708 RepID=UPI000847D18A|nr:porin [Pandoraea sp. ISTKB]ODP33806.1 porin [Pandoraea sp. ISTKB]